jgi:hypothetical protein
MFASSDKCHRHLYRWEVILIPSRDDTCLTKPEASTKIIISENAEGGEGGAHGVVSLVTVEVPKENKGGKDNDLRSQGLF